MAVLAWLWQVHATLAAHSAQPRIMLKRPGDATTNHTVFTWCIKQTHRTQVLNGAVTPAIRTSKVPQASTT
jgi:hypothetical protein